MNNELLQKMKNSMERIKETDVSGIKLEDFDERILFVDQLDIDTHLIIQAPALGYYNFLLSDAESELRSLKDSYDRWFKCKMSEASAQLMGSDPDAYKPTESDKKARVYINCKQEAIASQGKNEIDDWETRIREMEKYRDFLKYWCDTLTTKNFTLSHYINRQNIENGTRDSVKAKKDLTPIERPLSTVKRNLASEFRR